jgi:DNA polymerase-3 subunit epsilon
MSVRQVVVDTETTGLRVEEGHRIIEIGCIELIDRKLTGRRFHTYLNPEREVEAGALAVHGISNHFLKDKPIFSSVVDELIGFINQSELIIHNAPFDLSFLNDEIKRCQNDLLPVTQYCRVIDTLQLARQIHVGQKNSLDALFKRYGVDSSKREWHGALLDAHLLAQVYLAMTGGQGSFFDSHTNEENDSEIAFETVHHISNEKQQIIFHKATEDELQDHAHYLENMKKQGKCCWLELIEAQ